MLLKVAIITQSAQTGDGQARVNFELALGLLHEGHEVTLISGEASMDLRHFLRFSHVEIPFRRWPLALVRAEVFSIRSTTWLARNKSHFDIIHANGYCTLASSDVNTAHFVASSWLGYQLGAVGSIATWRTPYDLTYTAHNAIVERYAFRRARVVAAVSGAIRRQLAEIGVSSDRIRVIPNGVDITEFCPGSASRRDLGLPETVPIALFVGDSQTPRKNLSSVLRAMVDISSLHLAVAGSIRKSPLPALARQLEIDDRVHFLGYRNDVASLMRAADFFVFPSRYEANSLAILEALASGLPVVTASTAGAVELVGVDCGFVVQDPNDVESLQAAMCQLTYEPDLRKRMGVSGRRVAMENTWRHMVDRYVALYEEILQNRDTEV